MTTEHSPLPWSVENVYDGRRTIAIMRHAPGVGDSRIGPHINLPSDDASPSGYEAMDANADLIVRAVNAHADLVAVCEHAVSDLLSADMELHEALEESPGTPEGDEDRFGGTVARIRAALAKAKGE